MRELKMISELLGDLWSFTKKYQGISLTDAVCQELREEQERITEKYKAFHNVYLLASELFAAVLGYFLRSSQKGT